VNLQTILERVDLLIDNDISTQQKVTTINEISKQLFRRFPVPDKFVKFTTTNIPYYTLPDDVSEERIRSVVVNGIEYKRVTPEDDRPNRPFCTVVADHLFLYPNTPDQTCVIFYQPRHVELSASNLSAVPTFPEDYHEILVYGLAIWIAEIQRDVDMVNNFQRKYDEILKDAERHLRKMGNKRVIITNRW